MRCMMMTMPGSSSSRRRRCPLLGGETELFCASLVDGLAHLERTLEVDGGGGVPMRWCADALRLVKRMQREMLAIFRKADVVAAVTTAVSSGGTDKGGDWFEHYMQETAALLDFCNAFKAAVSRMHRYCMVVDFAARAGGRVAGGSSSDDDGGGAVVSLVAGFAAGAPPCDGWAPAAVVREKLASVKAAVAEAERLGRTVVASGGDAGGMVAVTLVAKITMAVVSVFVLQALTSRSPVDITTSSPAPPAALIGCAAVVPELEPWHKSLALIHGRFPSRATVAEHEKVSMVVQDLISGQMHGGGDRQGDEVARAHVELLQARSGELREGVELFDSVLDEVFDEVIRGRNEMLGILRDKALT